MTMPRCEPGTGKPVLLFLAGDEENSGAGDVRGPMPDGHRSVVSVHIGEDYSTCDWPVVVKVQGGFSPAYVADRLEDLVDSLRREDFGFWGEVPDELPDYVRRQADEDVRRLRVGRGGAPVQVVVDRPDEPNVVYRISVVRVEDEEQ
jgi:hypothetical protein